MNKQGLSLSNRAWLINFDFNKLRNKLVSLSSFYNFCLIINY